MGPIWGQQVPGGPHVGPMDFAIWVWFMYRLRLSATEIWTWYCNKSWLLFMNHSAQVAYPTHTLPECRCICVENPVTFFMMVTHELHSTTNWRRNSDIRHILNDCAPTFRHSIYLPRRCNNIKPIQPPIIRHPTYLEHTTCCKVGIPTTTTIAMHCDNTAKRNFCISN